MSSSSSLSSPLDNAAAPFDGKQLENRYNSIIMGMSADVKSHHKQGTSLRENHCWKCWAVRYFVAAHEHDVTVVEKPCENDMGEVPKLIFSTAFFAAVEFEGSSVFRTAMSVFERHPRTSLTWEDAKGVEAELIFLSMYKGQEDLALALLRLCPEEWRLKRATDALSRLGLPKMVAALLKGDAASGKIPAVDPWEAWNEDRTQTAVFVAVSAEKLRPSERLEVVKVLVEAMGARRALLTCCSAHDRTLMFHASRHGQLEVVKFLTGLYEVEGIAGGCFETSLPAGERPIAELLYSSMHAAALGGHLSVVQFFIQERNIPVNVVAQGYVPGIGIAPIYFGTALHMASRSSIVEKEEDVLPLIRWLVETAGADKTLREPLRQTAAEAAKAQGNMQVYAYLTREDRVKEADAARMALLAELDAEDEMQAKKKEKNKKKKEKKKQQQKKKQGTELAKEEEDVTAAAAAMDGLRLFADDEAAAGKYEKQDEDVPAAFLCGLTGKLMKSPVVAQEGVSYEAAALAQFLAAKQVGKPLVSPATGESMGEMSLPNHLLRTQIEEWVVEVGKKKEQGKGREAK